MDNGRPLGFMINLVARQLERRIAEALRPLGLTPAYMPVMVSLAQHQPQTQSDLAAALDIRQPTMAQTLSRMERDGLIVRRPDAHDRRATSVLLTQRATSLLGQIRELGAEVAEEATRGFTPERRARLDEDLRAICQNLSQ